jgi:hypothetical protein
MLAIATLGNEHNVVAIGIYCDNLPLIAMNIVVAIDQNPCSASTLFPTCDEVVNLTGLLETNVMSVSSGK